MVSDEDIAAYNEMRDRMLRMLFGSWLKSVRVEMGLTQAEFGKLFGITREHVGNIERGNNKPGLKTLPKMKKRIHQREWDRLDELERALIEREGWAG